MAESASAPQSLEARNHFLLRRLHSLTGIIPIGVFLIEHLLTNSMAAYGGPEKFNEDVHFLHGLPYLVLLEIFGIFLPLAFHALYGIRIAMTAKHNVMQYPYMENRRYFAQRMTGYIAFLFLIIHLAKFRFAHWFGGIPFLDPQYADKFEITRRGLMDWNFFGTGTMIPAPITLTLYFIGLAAAVYHFANGIFTFCITWGITVGEKSQKRMSLVSLFVGLVLFAWGTASLVAFANAPARPLPNWDNKTEHRASADEAAITHDDSEAAGMSH